MDDVGLLLLCRRLAKDDKDFGLADRLRDELANIGVSVVDGHDGQCIASDKRRIEELEMAVKFYRSLNGGNEMEENYRLRRENEQLRAEAALHKNMRALAEKKLVQLQKVKYVSHTHDGGA